MAKSTSFFMICAVIILITNMISVTGSHHEFNWLPTTVGDGVCKGSMAECLASGDGDEFELDEFQMDSEINRRLLQARRRYISYAALSRNSVPCSRRGASYYNCRNGGQANPYSRGCSTITRCRR